MSDSDKKAAEDGASAPLHDASLRVDPRSLSSDDKAFAQMMGFGDEEPEQDAPPPRKPAARKPAPSVVPAAAGSAERETRIDASSEPTEHVNSESPAAVEAASTSDVESDESPRGIDESANANDAATATAADESGSDPAPAVARDWEEIHPRAASLGRQSALLERADRVARLEEHAEVGEPCDAGAAPIDPAPQPAADGAAAIDVAALRARLLASEQQIAELESNARALETALRERDCALEAHTDATAAAKDADASQLELDALLLERDQLGDALAAANTARSEAQERADRLEAALRAARSPSGPVPDGERALRAEVIGLRRRLEETGDECRRLRASLDERATELAIAQAHRDDRQNEIDQHRARIESMERERAATLERLDEALARQRELLALATRVQSENAELRSTQSALEETLEARDLEISAREEHLAVTRRGLATRDEQLLDASERLEQARHRHELLEGELDRARLAQSELEQKIARRDARIASLSATLARIEEAIGRPVARVEPEPPAPLAAAVPEAANEAAHGAEIAAVARESEAPPPEPIADPESASELDSGAQAPAAIARIRPAAPAPALTAWRSEKLRSLLGEETDLAGFLARQVAERFATAMPGPLRISSLGGPSLEAEVELARALATLGVDGVEIDVLDADDDAAEARRAAVEAAGLSASIAVRSGDGVADMPADPIHALFCCDALFDQPDPEAILDGLAARLAPESIVLFSDRIAGGALTLSDETCEKLAELWEVLPESWTSQPAFADAPSAGDDGGVSGPPADLPAALRRRFTPLVTIGFGHLADLALGPARGPAVSDLGSAAEAFLTSIDALDESRTIAESLPPRFGVAVLIPRDGAAESAGSAPLQLGSPWADSPEAG